MTISYCKHCITRYVTDSMCNDFDHTCNSGNPVLDQEDILVIGDRVEEFGATVNTGRTPAIITEQSTANKLQGTMAGVLGGKDPGYTVRGNNAQTMRQRQHFELNNPNDKLI